MKKIFLLLIALIGFQTATFAEYYPNMISTNVFMVNLMSECTNLSEYQTAICLVIKMNSIPFDEEKITIPEPQDIKLLSTYATINCFATMNGAKGDEMAYKLAIKKWADIQTSHYFTNAIDSFADKLLNDSTDAVTSDYKLDGIYPSWLVYTVKACEPQYINLRVMNHYNQENIHNYAKCLANKTLNNKNSYTFKQAGLPFSVLQFLGYNSSPCKNFYSGKPGEVLDLMRIRFYKRMLYWSNVTFGD